MPGILLVPQPNGRNQGKRMETGCTVFLYLSEWWESGKKDGTGILVPQRMNCYWFKFMSKHPEKQLIEPNINTRPTASKVQLIQQVQWQFHKCLFLNGEGDVGIAISHLVCVSKAAGCVTLCLKHPKEFASPRALYCKPDSVF